MFWDRRSISAGWLGGWLGVTWWPRRGQDSLRKDLRRIEETVYDRVASALLLILPCTIIFLLPPLTLLYDNRWEIQRYLCPDRLRHNVKRNTRRGNAHRGSAPRRASSQEDLRKMIEESTHGLSRNPDHGSENWGASLGDAGAGVPVAVPQAARALPAFNHPAATSAEVVLSEVPPPSTLVPPPSTLVPPTRPLPKATGSSSTASDAEGRSSFGAPAALRDVELLPEGGGSVSRAPEIGFA